MKSQKILSFNLKYSINILILFLASTAFCNSYATELEQDQNREFIINTVDSTKTSPSCILITKKLTEIVHVVDAAGNVSNIPIIKSYVNPGICTEKARPYNKVSGNYLNNF